MALPDPALGLPLILEPDRPRTHARTIDHYTPPMAERAADRGRWIEPFLALIFAVFMGVTGPWSRPELILVDAAICISAALSGRFPRIAAIVGGAALMSYLLVPGTDVTTAGLALFLNIFAAFRRGIPERLPITIILTALIYFALVRHAYGNSDVEPGATAVLVVFLAVAIGAGHGWHQAQLRLATERQSAEEKVLDLRTSLARDLHDTVAQTLSHAAMRANMAAMHPEATPELSRQLELIAADCGSASQDLRQLLQTLREQDTVQGPSVGPLADSLTLRETVESQSARLAGEGFKPATRVDVGQISAARSTTLSKVTVEAVSNMIKHAPRGGECTIDIYEDSDNVIAEFTNPQGPMPVGRRGLGLIGIEERAALLGGRCTVDRAHGLWRLKVSLPHGYEARVNDVSRTSPAGIAESTAPSDPAQNR